MKKKMQYAEIMKANTRMTTKKKKDGGKDE